MCLPYRVDKYIPVIIFYSTINILKVYLFTRVVGAIAARSRVFLMEPEPYFLYGSGSYSNSTLKHVIFKGSWGNLNFGCIFF